MSKRSKKKSQKSTPKQTSISTKWVLPVILLLTALVYGPALDNEFVNFDDQLYVTENNMVQEGDVAAILSEGTAGNYHPLTMLSLAWNYSISELDAGSYHWVNVLLHLLNTALVFWLVRLVSSGKTWIAAITALFFGIHPMHVESVAWISERKDVLFAAFYLGAMIVHWRHLQQPAITKFLLVLLLGALAMASKPAAVTLPVVLLLLDWLKQGKLSLKQGLEKLPLIAMAVGLGLYTISLQTDVAIGDATQYSFLEKISFASYGILFYLLKAIVPTGLSAMHPYPNLEAGLPAIFFGSTIAATTLLAFWAYRARSHRMILFLGGFYLINLALVLQLVSVGRAIVAERYAYLPHIAVFWGLALLWDHWRNQPKTALYSKGLLACIAVLGLFSLAETTTRNDVWQTSETLWTDVMEKYPNDWYAYIGRGNYFRDLGLPAKALPDYTQALAVAPGQYRNYFNRGDAYYSLGQVKEALTDYNQGLAINPEYGGAYTNRGQYLFELGQTNDALEDFNKAVNLAPDAKAYNNRGNVLLALNRTTEALSDYDQALSLNPNYADGFYNRGIAQLKVNELDKAIADFQRAIQLNPQKAEAYNNMGNAQFNKGDFQGALNTFTLVTQRFPNFGTAWKNRAIILSQLGKSEDARASATQARKLGEPFPDELFNRL